MRDRHIALDFSRVQPREWTDVWYCLPSEVETALAGVPDTLARLQGALRCRGLLDSDSESQDALARES